MTFSRLKTIALVLMALTAVGLGGWYVYLRATHTRTATENALRPPISASPTFGGVVGSTYRNAVQRIAASGGSSTEEKDSRIIEISQAPVAGFAFLGTGTGTRLRFLDRATGNVIDANLRGTLTRQSSTLVPGIHDAYLYENGAVLISEGKEGLSISLGTFGTTTSEGTELETRPLPSALSLAVIGEELAYIAPRAQGGFALYRGDIGKPAATLLPTNLSAWHLYGARGGKTVMVQKALDGQHGLARMIEEKGVVTPLVSAPGLILLPHPRIDAFLYSTSENGGELYIRSGSTTKLLPIRTLAEKCAWVPTASSTAVAYCGVPQGGPPSLGAWYRGEVHTEDSLWRVDATGNAEEVALGAPLSADIERPLIDASGGYLAFRNGVNHALMLVHLAP
jgi:hypothetical protein